ncbi:MAG: ATP-dependent DNA ligase, partial [Steroidobacterales bacterium]
MTLLATLAATSQRVAATPARLVKVRELAALLRSLRSDEIEIVAHYLSGEPPQGRIGIGYATLADAAQVPAATATLSVADVDRQLTALTAARGSGSAGRRAALLRELFSLATAAEQQFLTLLLMGELRQGALAAVMTDAIAAAA